MSDVPFNACNELLSSGMEREPSESEPRESLPLFVNTPVAWIKSKNLSSEMDEPSRVTQSNGGVRFCIGARNAWKSELDMALKFMERIFRVWTIGRCCRAIRRR